MRGSSKFRQFADIVFLIDRDNPQGKYPVFWIDRFHPHSIKQHTAFVAKSQREVDAFHAAALKAGGVDNGAPGLRDPAKGFRQAVMRPFWKSGAGDPTSSGRR